jgi:ATP-dependent helicase YprA (DUF1998 family)
VFLRNLKFVVLDEAHSLAGAFGSHTALVLRRMTRLCQLYGNPGPQFVLCSATIGNPRQHLARLVPSGSLGWGYRPHTAITSSGAPTCERHFVLWNPPLLSKVRSCLSGKDESINVSPILATAADMRTGYNKTAAAGSEAGKAPSPLQEEAHALARLLFLGLKMAEKTISKAAAVRKSNFGVAAAADATAPPRSFLASVAEAAHVLTPAVFEQVRF